VFAKTDYLCVVDGNEKPIGAHGGGIPPGWEFPEARAAAEDGVDLWMLDSNLRLSIWRRLEENFQFASMIEFLRRGMPAPNK
jgi:hypothetical protein